MNPLLRRQIRKFLPENLQNNEEMKSFLEAIEDSYDNFDEQFKMTQRAMRISSEELFNANMSLKNETQQQQALLNRLQEVINKVKPLNASQNDELIEGSNLAEYISSQAEQLIEVNSYQEKLLEELEQQNKELSDYAHIVSHDLKSPLRSIAALVSWLKEDYSKVIGEEGSKQFELIVSNLEKMDALISGILSYSTIDKNESTDRKLDLNKIVDETIKLLNIPSHIKVTVHKLPSITADKFKIQQLFQNLICNAACSIDKPEGDIQVVARDTDKFYQFEISDNGKGIKEDYFEKIFQVFQKLENDSNSTGIGLSIVKKIVNFYKGKIWLDSEVGKGTTFYFTLPKN